MAVWRGSGRRVVAAAAAAVGAIQGVTAAYAVPRQRRDWADPVWGPGLAAVALTSAATGTGDRSRRWTLDAITAAWATRLAILTGQKALTHDEEDPRYTEFLEGDGPAAVVGKVFVTQGLAQLLVTAPLQAAAVLPLARSARRWWFPVGAAVMVAGAVVEATADRQKQRYTERDRDERPDVLDTGLWGWSRHPNYFGDACVWWGAWLAAAGSSPGWRTTVLTAPAPAAMTYFLVFATGARRTERIMQERPGYRDYQRRVSFFVPLPPRERT